MNNTCPYPDCGAAYDLSSQPVGARFACRQCGQSLVVETEGLRMSSGPPVPPPRPPAPSASAGASAAQIAEMAPQVVERMQRLADLPTWLFGAGTLIGLCALFFPLIDQAKVSRLEAMIVAGDMRQERLNEQAKREDATADDRDDAKEAAKWWRSRKDYLEESVESAELWRRGWLYWYRYLTLFAFGLLVLGSFGYLDPRQSMMRRVLGCIVLTATVLVVLNSLARTSFRLEVGSGPF